MAGMAGKLGEACRRARVENGVHAITIATRAGVSESTVSRFEHGDGWRRDTDEIVRAYAVETGVDERELWRRALED